MPAALKTPDMSCQPLHNLHSLLQFVQYAPVGKKKKKGTKKKQSLMICIREQTLTDHCLWLVRPKYLLILCQSEKLNLNEGLDICLAFLLMENDSVIAIPSPHVCALQPRREPKGKHLCPQSWLTALLESERFRSKHSKSFQMLCKFKFVSSVRWLFYPHQEKLSFSKATN